MDPASAFPYKPEGVTNMSDYQNIEDSLLDRNVTRVGESSRAWLQSCILTITMSSTLL